MMEGLTITPKHSIRTVKPPEYMGCAKQRILQPCGDRVHGRWRIAETAKANNLKPYEYFEYLLTEIPNHMDDIDQSFCEDLPTWSQNLPEHCRKPEKNSNKSITEPSWFHDTGWLGFCIGTCYLPFTYVQSSFIWYMCFNIYVYFIYHSQLFR